MKAAILAIDTKLYQGEKEDTCTPVVNRILEQVGFQVLMEKAIPKDFDVVKAVTARVVEENLADLIVSIGGEGCKESDCVPEATKAIIERDVPGMAEAMRAYMLRTSKRTMLSRGVVGIRKNTLIINLPNSPMAIREIFDYLMPEIVHLIETLMGQHEE
jgi:Molybdopterin biosynthesis enzymes